MARSPAFRVARCRRADQSAALNRTLRRWLSDELGRLRRLVEQSAAHCQADRYRKHFSALDHSWLLVFHGLSGKPSLHQSYAAFAAAPSLLAASGLERITPAGDPALGVSYSQFAASNTSRPAAFLACLVPPLLARARALGHRAPTGPWPAGLEAIDSTFVRLSLKLAPWLPHATGDQAESDIGGVRLQVRFTPARDLPERVVVTDTRTNDYQGLDALVLDDPAELQRLRDHTLVIDLGYYSHQRFARLREARIHFVTRQHPQAQVQVEAALAVQPPLPDLAGQSGRIRVLHDQRVTVGSAHNRRGAVLVGLRRVIAAVAPLPAAARRGASVQRYELLTDRWDLSAQEVVQLYLWRWQIELFFRWLKKYVHLTRWLGYSPNAVELTVWLALVVHLLAMLATHALGRSRRSPALLGSLAATLMTIDPLLPEVEPQDGVIPPSAAEQLPLPWAV